MKKVCKKVIAGESSGPRKEKTEQPAAHDIYVEGVEAPVARLRQTAEGVELTLTGEREAGFLAWVAEHRDAIVVRPIRDNEHEKVIDGLELPPNGDDR